MRGHILKRTGKRGTYWDIVLDMGRDASGKRRQKWIRGLSTKKEAEIKLADVQHNINSHIITLSGNSKTIDVVETSMGEQSAFTGDTTFPDLIKNALKNSGITGIEVINKVSNLRPISETEFSEGSVGESVFNFIERYAQKLQVFLTDDVDGNIVIFKGEGNGHGVGMCQFGAFALAKKGWSYNKILEYYYPGHKRKKIY